MFFTITFILLGLGIWDIYSNRVDLKNKIFIGSLIVLGVLLGTRNFVGTDWYFYYPHFMEGKIVYEVGYNLYAKFIGGIYKNFTFYQCINVLVDFSILYIVIKRYSKYKLLALALFFSIHGLVMEVDLLRNFKSILLFILSIKYIEEEKPLQFLMFNTLGVLFHSSAIIFFPMYFILKRKYTNKVILFVFFLGIGYYLTNQSFFIELIEFIGNKIGGGIGEKLVKYFQIIPKIDRGINLFFIERVILFLIIYKYEGNNILKNSMYIYIFLFLFFSEFSIVFLRIAIMFSYSLWFCLARVFENEIEKKEKIFLILCVLGISIFRADNFLNYSGSQINYKYRNVFFNSKTYLEREKELIESKKDLLETHGKELLIQY